MAFVAHRSGHLAAARGAPPLGSFLGWLCLSSSGYHEYFTLFALNRGFVVMPWENMLLTSPCRAEEDNDRFIAMFDEWVARMIGR